MADKFPFTLVTPTGIVYEGPVVQAVAIGALGEFGVLAGHTNYITAIEPGMLTLYVDGGGTTEYLLSGGLAEVKNGAMTILALDAQPPASIDSTAAAAEIPAAEAKLAGVNAYDAGYAEIEQELQLARARTAIEQLHRVHS